MPEQWFEVLDPDYQGEAWAMAHRVQAFDATLAAESWVERHWSGMEYPDLTTVWVRPRGASEHQVFEVEARPSVDFYARQRRG